MRRNVLTSCICPNSKLKGFRVFANELERDNRILMNLDHEEIFATDDVKTGYVINEQSGRAYPIANYVLSLLSDQDLDKNFYAQTLKQAKEYSPSSLKDLLQDNVCRLQALSESNKTGKWNREEMQYYDREVKNDELRDRFLTDIRKTPLWHIFIERDRHAIKYVKRNDQNKKLLEIGCGNARTITWLYPPKVFQYEYFGADISMERLFLAKRVLPEGNFIQCSAFNLPFEDGSFNTIISFGVLHHLADPIAGLEDCLSKLANAGYFVMHEPLKRPRKLLADGQWELVKRWFATYEHSEHDGTIELRPVQELLTDAGLVVKHQHLCGTLLRTVTSRLYEMLPRIKGSRLMWNLLISADEIVRRAFCHRPNRLGPKGVYLVAQRRNAVGV